MSDQTHIKNNYSHELIIWLSSFIALCLSFSPLLFNFIWGNHDWLPLISDTSLQNGFIEGRVTQYILPNIILMGKILPILNILFGFMAYTLAIILLYRFFFNFKISYNHTFIFILCVTTLPYICEILYFQFVSFSILSWPLFIIISLIFAQKASTEHPVLYTSLSTLFLLFTLAGYPPAVNMFITATICYTISKISSKETTLKKLCIHIIPFIISLFISLISIKLLFAYMQKEHLMMLMYNNQINTITEILQKIPTLIKNSLYSFVRPQPFFSILFKTISTAIVLLFIINYLQKSSNKKQFILSLISLIILSIGIKFSAWFINTNTDNPLIANDSPYFMLRADFFAIPTLLLFCLFYTYSHPNQWQKNLITFLSLILLYQNISSNLTFCKTHLFGFTAENKLLERITARIQEHPDYIDTSHYAIIQAGELPLRHKYYSGVHKNNSGYYTLNVPYFRHWVAFEYYNFYNPTDFIQSYTAISPSDITSQMFYYLTNRITAWPSQNSLYIDKKHIILPLTTEGKNMLTGQFKQLSGYAQ